MKKENKLKFSTDIDFIFLGVKYSRGGEYEINLDDSKLLKDTHTYKKGKITFL